MALCQSIVAIASRWATAFLGRFYIFERRELVHILFIAWNFIIHNLLWRVKRVLRDDRDLRWWNILQVNAAGPSAAPLRLERLNILRGNSVHILCLDLHRLTSCSSIFVWICLAPSRGLQIHHVSPLGAAERTYRFRGTPSPLMWGHNQHSLSDLARSLWKACFGGHIQRVLNWFNRLDVIGGRRACDSQWGAPCSTLLRRRSPFRRGLLFFRRSRP